MKNKDEKCNLFIYNAPRMIKNNILREPDAKNESETESAKKARKNKENKQVTLTARVALDRLFNY